MCWATWGSWLLQLHTPHGYITLNFTIIKTQVYQCTRLPVTLDSDLLVVCSWMSGQGHLNWHLSQWLHFSSLHWCCYCTHKYTRPNRDLDLVSMTVYSSGSYLALSVSVWRSWSVYQWSVCTVRAHSSHSAAHCSSPWTTSWGHCWRHRRTWWHCPTPCPTLDTVLAAVLSHDCPVIILSNILYCTWPVFIDKLFTVQ